MKILLRLLKNYDDNTIGKTLFKNKYSTGFKHQLYNVIKLFTQNYIFNINRQLYYLDNKEYIPNEHYHTIEKIFQKKNKEWANKFLSK
jgi:hypothetical protein